MRKISSVMVAVLATVSFSTSVVAENPCGGGGTAGKPKPKDTPVKADKAEVKVQPTGEAPASQMPEKPTPPPELLALAKAQKGSWTCTGEMQGAAGGYKTKMKVVNKLDLGNMWMRSDVSETKSKATKYPFKFTSFTTFNAAESKWHRVMLDNWGGIGKGWSTGPDAAGKTTWEMEMSSSMGNSKFRDYEEPGTKKKTTHMWGEMSMDGGKSWVKVYDITCKKP